MSKLGEAIALAAKVHADQLYGDEPYVMRFFGTTALGLLFLVLVIVVSMAVGAVVMAYTKEATLIAVLAVSWFFGKLIATVVTK